MDRANSGACSQLVPLSSARWRLREGGKVRGERGGTGYDLRNKNSVFLTPTYGSPMLRGSDELAEEKWNGFPTFVLLGCGESLSKKRAFSLMVALKRPYMRNS